MQEEKLSYSESLREPTGSAPGLLEKLEEEGSSTLQHSSPLFPASVWQSPLRLPEPVSRYRLPLLELLWFSLFRDSKEKSREPGWFALTGVFSMGISFCGEKKEHRSIESTKYVHLWERTMICCTVNSCIFQSHIHACATHSLLLLLQIHNDTKPRSKSNIAPCNSSRLQCCAAKQ